MKFIRADNLKIVYDYEPIVINNVQYPPEFPKTEIRGLIKIVEPEKPTINETQRLSESVELVNGVWTVVYTVTDIPQEEITAMRKALVPSEISRFQALSILSQYGLYSSVKAYINSNNTTEMQKIAFNEASVFLRSSPTMINIASLLNITEEQLDQMFIEAIKIVA